MTDRPRGEDDRGGRGRENAVRTEKRLRFEKKK